MACRKHDVTVQAALQAAAALALSRLIKNPDLSTNIRLVPDYLNIHTGCAIDMRSFITKMPKNAIGCYFSVRETKVNVSEDSEFWKVALENKRQIYNNPQRSIPDYHKQFEIDQKFGLNMPEIAVSPPHYGRYPGLQLGLLGIVLS